MGVGRLPLAIPRYVLIAIGKELCYHCVGFWYTAAELVGRNTGCWLFGGAAGASAWGVLWSLDVVLTIAACLHCFSGGMFHSVKLNAGQMRIMN